MSVREPILLRTGEPLTVSTMTVTVSTDALPTAEITTPDAPKMHDLVEIFTAQGSAGIFRVTDRQESYGGMVTATLRGALDTLSDDLWEGENAISGTIPAVIGQILSHQTVTRWQLGTCARTNSIKLDNRYTGLMELLEGVMQEAPGCRWVCDYTTTPWTLSLAEMDPTVVAEFRIGRNVESASIDLSDAEMCTRLYMTVSTDSSSQLYTYDNAEAQAEWGVICRTADVKAENCPIPEAYGRAILAERAQPIAYISLDGFDLAALTGDAFDRITLGSHCRVTLDGYATAFEEVVTQITWPDVFGEPEHINVNLANNLKPFTEQLNLIKKTGSGTASKVEEQERELVRHQTSIDRTDERIGLWATEEQWYALAQEYSETGRTQIDITSDEFSSVITQSGVLPGVKPFTPTKAYAVGDHVIWAGKTWEFTTAHTAGTPWNPAEVTEIKALESRITQTENDLSAEVTRATGAESSLSTSLTLKADKATLISQINSSTESTPIAYGKLEVQPGSVLIQAINGGTGHSNIKLEADTIDIDGIVTALRSKNLYAAQLETAFLDFLVGQGQSLSLSGGLTAHSIRIQGGTTEDPTYTNVSNAVKNVQIIPVTGTDSYKLQYQTWTDGASDWHDAGTFSRAASVTPTLSGTWDGGHLTIISSPTAAQNLHYYLDGGTATWTGTTASIPIRYRTTEQGQPQDTGGVATLNVASKLQARTVTPTASQQIIEPESGYVGLSQVTVNAATPSGSVSIRHEWYNTGADAGVTNRLTSTGTAAGVSDGTEIVWMMLSVNATAGTAYVTDMSTSPGTVVLNRSFSVPTIGQKPATITANGTYDATDDSLDGYSRVVVDVPTGSHTTQHLNCADSLYQVNAVSTAQATQMYAYVNGTLTNMGTGFWYRRDTYQQTRTMYT